VEEEPAAKNAPNRVRKGVSQGLNHGVERGAEKRELRGVEEEDKYIINI
jgi:hypothetical protein